MKFQDIIDREFNELLEMSAGNSIDKQIKKIAMMTDQNDHNGSMIAGLRMMGNDALIKKLIKKMEVIQDEHEKLGHMSSHLMGDRLGIMKKMMSIAKKRLGDKFKAFHGAF